ncbi:uncharacterized protein LOC135494532 [Lineus longissimus]|uniref:uncharacterized protein LOC135494532 n=1 Tax=Lineus longissimus TaxID=88925 RepID=UPI002B4C660D
MMVVCPKRLFVDFVIFLFLLSYSLGRGPDPEAMAFSTGCYEVKNEDGKSLSCSKVSLLEISARIHWIGRDLVYLYIWDCPSESAELTESFFGNNINLKDIIISRCNINNIGTSVFEKLSRLKYLDLNSNRISQVTKEVFKGLTNLSSLTLLSNEIYEIQEGTFENLVNLSELNLESNKLDQFDNGILFGLKNLETFSLGDQEIERDLRECTGPAIDDLRGLTRLKDLNLAGVSLCALERESDLSLFFKDQEETMTVLDLSSTQLTNTILPILRNLKRLKNLNLRGNNLGYILDGSLPKLASDGLLDLSFNRVMYIDELALTGFDGGLDIMFNSFYCDCKLLGFTNWLQEYARSGSVDVSMILCSGPVSMYGTKVVDYSPYWWQCSQYIPLIALVAVIAFAVLLALVTLVVYCNRVNFKHWLLERRAAAKAEKEAEQESAATERSALVPPNRLCGINSLPKGMTGAYILYNMDEVDVKRWVDQHIEEKLYRHPMKITLQWAAGPGFMPLWKQVKDYGFGVRHFLVVITEELLRHHWQQMSENGGVENLSKFVLVLWGKKKEDLPADLRRLRCPCIEWPMTEPKFSSLQREREQFWKRVRLALKDLSD